MKKHQSLNLTASIEKVKALLGKIYGYKTFIFFLAVASVYGFIIWRINYYSNTLPSQSEKTAQATPQPHIDANTIQKLQSLQDNSVSVQSLFDAARSNPFQE